MDSEMHPKLGLMEIRQIAVLNELAPASLHEIGLDCPIVVAIFSRQTMKSKKIDKAMFHKDTTKPEVKEI